MRRGEVGDLIEFVIAPIIGFALLLLAVPWLFGLFLVYFEWVLRLLGVDLS